AAAHPRGGVGTLNIGRPANIATRLHAASPSSAASGSQGALPYHDSPGSSSGNHLVSRVANIMAATGSRPERRNSTVITAAGSKDCTNTSPPSQLPPSVHSVVTRNAAATPTARRPVARVATASTIANTTPY